MSDKDNQDYQSTGNTPTPKRTSVRLHLNNEARLLRVAQHRQMKLSTLVNEILSLWLAEHDDQWKAKDTQDIQGDPYTPGDQE
jgi:predicted DNA-binding protein